MNKNIDKSIAQIKVRTPGEFFREWVKITISYSKLTPKEADFLTVLLTRRYELSLVIKDEKYLSKILFGKESKEEMVVLIGMKNVQIWDNMATKLRSKDVILENNLINPRFAPRISGKIGKFTITFEVELNDKG